MVLLRDLLQGKLGRKYCPIGGVFAQKSTSCTYFPLRLLTTKRSHNDYRPMSGHATGQDRQDTNAGLRQLEQHDCMQILLAYGLHPRGKGARLNSECRPATPCAKPPAGPATQPPATVPPQAHPRADPCRACVAAELRRQDNIRRSVSSMYPTLTQGSSGAVEAARFPA